VHEQFLVSRHHTAPTLMCRQPSPNEQLIITGSAPGAKSARRYVRWGGGGWSRQVVVGSAGQPPVPFVVLRGVSAASTVSAPTLSSLASNSPSLSGVRVTLSRWVAQARSWRCVPSGPGPPLCERVFYYGARRGETQGPCVVDVVEAVARRGAARLLPLIPRIPDIGCGAHSPPRYALPWCSAA
jgi:hypothetical protein